MLDGEIEVVRGATVVATVEPGHLTGELAALDGGPRTATLRAATDAVLLVIPSRPLEALLRDVDAVRSAVVRELTGKVRALAAR